jgi:hypothetical protein
MTNETLSLLGAAAGGIFGAGVAWATMRQRLNKTATDVNGLGRKFGRLVALLILWADTEEKRRQLSEAIEPK